MSDTDEWRVFCLGVQVRGCGDGIVAVVLPHEVGRINRAGATVSAMVKGVAMKRR